jgi:predicted transcriptional regulator
MDWQKLIGDLQEAGLSQVEIAQKCGCSQPTINDLSTGKNKNPRYSIGDALRRLHAKRKPVTSKAA